MKPKLERAEAEAREEVEANAEAETRRSANEDAERERDRETEKAGKVRGPAEWKRERAESDTSNESQLLELVYEERGDGRGELSPRASQHLVPRAQRARATRVHGCITNART